MRNRKNINILIIILLLGLIVTGCKQKENEATDKSEIQSAPSALEQVQQQSDEIVISTMAKDWAGSLDLVKELQSTWSDLYPDIQKQGAKQEDIDAFVAGLNTLTDYLISKTLNLPQETAEEEKKDEQNPEQEAQQSPGQEQEDEQSPGQEQDSQHASEGENKEEESEEQQSQQQEEEQDTEEKKDPQEILNEIDPLISASQEDLVIINSSVDLTKYIPKFMSLFESPVPPDLFKLKYLVRNLHVASKLGYWDVVSADFESVLETWESVQPKVLEADADLKTQLVQNINELEDVINSKNANLTGVKSNFIIEQIESLTKTIKEKEEEKKEE